MDMEISENDLYDANNDLLDCDSLQKNNESKNSFITNLIKTKTSTINKDQSDLSKRKSSQQELNEIKKKIVKFELQALTYTCKICFQPITSEMKDFEITKIIKCLNCYRKFHEKCVSLNNFFVDKQCIMCQQNKKKQKKIQKSSMNLTNQPTQLFSQGSYRYSFKENYIKQNKKNLFKYNKDSHNKYPIEKNYIADFKRQYPLYTSKDKVIFPILDEYLTIYTELCGLVNQQKKPQPTIETSIPQEVYSDILFIWDIYNNLLQIVSDVIISDNLSDLKTVFVGIGTFEHFKNASNLLQNQTRQEIYDGLMQGYQSNIKDIFKFFVCFYLKSIFEDQESELSNQKQINVYPRFNNVFLQKYFFWPIINFLWLSDKKTYFRLLDDLIFQLPLLLYEFGYFQNDPNNMELFERLKLYCIYILRLALQKQENGLLRKSLMVLAEGVIEQKRTPTILSFRTEQIFQKIKQKQKLSNQIQSLRSDMVKIQQLPQGEEQDELKRKNQINFSLQKEDYYRLRSQLQFVKVGQLLYNQSAFLGFDAKNSLYYFFLQEPNKIFVNFKDTYLDEESEQKWGYAILNQIIFRFYSSKSQFNQLISSLNIKGVKENNLKTNLEELLKCNLLRLENENELKDNYEIKAQLDMDNDQQDDIINLRSSEILLRLEEKLSLFLLKNNRRWASQQIRIQFREKLKNCKEDINILIEQCQYFLEHTYSQEKLQRIQSHEIEIRFDLIDQKQYLLFEKKNLIQNQLPIPGFTFNIFDKNEGNFETFSQQIEFNSNDHIFNDDEEDVKILKRVPLKIFGYNNEGFRVQMIQTLKVIQENFKYANLLKLIMVALFRLINDYVSKIKNDQQLKNNQSENIEEKKPLQQSYNLRKKGNQEDDQVCVICQGRQGYLIICSECGDYYHMKCMDMFPGAKGSYCCKKCTIDN